MIIRNQIDILISELHQLKFEYKAAVSEEGHLGGLISLVEKARLEYKLQLIDNLYKQLHELVRLAVVNKGK